MSVPSSAGSLGTLVPDFLASPSPEATTGKVFPDGTTNMMTGSFNMPQGFRNPFGSQPMWNPDEATGFDFGQHPTPPELLQLPSQPAPRGIKRPAAELEEYPTAPPNPASTNYASFAALLAPRGQLPFITPQRPSTAPTYPSLPYHAISPLDLPPPPAAGDANSDYRDNERKSRFVHKLYKMVEEAGLEDCIAWNPAGTSVIISDVDTFSTHFLGQHFNHNNFSSLVRQLNMYGFYKINKAQRSSRASGQPQAWEFSHPHFLRGRTDLLDTIRRRTLDSESVRSEATRDLQADMHVSYARVQAQVTATNQALTAARLENSELWKFARQLRESIALVVNHSQLSGSITLPPTPPQLSSTSPSMAFDQSSPQSFSSDPFVFAHYAPPPTLNVRDDRHFCLS